MFPNYIYDNILFYIFQLIFENNKILIQNEIIQFSLVSKAWFKIVSYHLTKNLNYFTYDQLKQFIEKPKPYISKKNKYKNKNQYLNFISTFQQQQQLQQPKNQQLELNEEINNNQIEKNQIYKLIKLKNSIIKFKNLNEYKDSKRFYKYNFEDFKKVIIDLLDFEPYNVYNKIIKGQYPKNFEFNLTFRSFHSNFFENKSSIIKKLKDTNKEKSKIRSLSIVLFKDKNFTNILNLNPEILILNSYTFGCNLLFEIVYESKTSILDIHNHYLIKFNDQTIAPNTLEMNRLKKVIYKERFSELLNQKMELISKDQNVQEISLFHLCRESFCKCDKKLLDLYSFYSKILSYPNSSIHTFSYNSNFPFSNEIINGLINNNSIINLDISGLNTTISLNLKNILIGNKSIRNLNISKILGFNSVRIFLEILKESKIRLYSITFFETNLNYGHLSELFINFITNNQFEIKEFNIIISIDNQIKPKIIKKQIVTKYNSIINILIK